MHQNWYPPVHQQMKITPVQKEAAEEIVLFWNSFSSWFDKGRPTLKELKNWVIEDGF